MSQGFHLASKEDLPRLEPAGYTHPDYARALAEFGAPLALSASGGWLLKRPVEGTGICDAMGTYPLFCCANWKALAGDLNALRGDLVSAVLVADPFGEHDEPLLAQCFDRVVPFKTHFVVDLDQPGPYGTSHHRYYANRALRDVSVQISDAPNPMIEEWIGLYQSLIERHSIKGLQAFSRESFCRQFAVPGLTYFRATTSSHGCVGAHLWFVQGEVAYSHLAAANEWGYQLGCSYALHSAAIEAFRGKVRWLDLGGSAGYSDGLDGLARFKRGWANTSRTAFLCCRILNPQRYQDLVRLAGTAGTTYFPAYRYRHAT